MALISRYVASAMLSCIALISPAHADDLQEQANLCSSGTEKQLAACSAVIDNGQLSDQGLAAAFNNRGNLYLKMGKVTEALSDFTNALALDPQNPTRFFAMGAAYLKMNAFDSARQYFDKALQMKPDYEEALQSRGFAFASAGQFTRAMEDFDRVVALKPDSELSYMARGLAYAQAGQKDKAITDFSKAIELKPTDATAFYLRGNAEDDIGDRSRAKQDYNRAIELKPDDFKVLANRGKVYADLGQYDLAIRDLDRSISLQPTALAFDSRASAYARLGQARRAIQDDDKAIALEPNFSPARMRRARLLESTGQYQSAIRDYDVLVQAAPREAGAYRVRCAARAKWGQQLDVALADCNKSIQLSPGDKAPIGVRALVYFRMGRFNDAISDLNTFLQDGNRYAWALYVRGAAEIHRGDVAAGNVDIADARAIDAKIVDAYAAFVKP